MITYKGLPAPLICDFLSREDSETFYEEGTRFQIGKIEMVANTGTYLDCPFHRYEDGKDFSEMFVEKMVDLEGVLISVPCEENFEVGVQHLKGIALQGKAVLIHTGWSKYWRTDRYFENHPFVSREAALFLKEQKVKLVGIDALNIDDTRSGAHLFSMEAFLEIAAKFCFDLCLFSGPFLISLTRERMAKTKFC